MEKKFCSKCGSKLESSDEFCANCGAPLNDTGKTKPQNSFIQGNNKIIFLAIGVIIILAVGVILIGGMGTGVPLTHADFDLFEIDVPEGSNFEVYKSFSTNVIYENDGKYSEDVASMTISVEPMDTTLPKLVEESDNMLLYTVDENSFIAQNGGADNYELVYQKDGAYFYLYGQNPDLLKQMAETIVVKLQ